MPPSSRRRPVRVPGPGANAAGEGVFRKVIALPVAVTPPLVPLHLWVLERPDEEAGPDLLALLRGSPGEPRHRRLPPTSSTAGDDALGKLAGILAHG